MFSIIADASELREHVLLRNGQSVLLRLAQEKDIPALEELLARVSRESLQMRFMAGVSQVPRKFVEALVSDDLRDRACLLAIIGEEPHHTVAGFGNYVALGVRNTAEVAFLVDDDFQGRGVSTLLLERLAGIAAGVGIVAFEAEVLFENQAMINVFRSSGFEARQALEGGSFHVEFPVGGAAALRERGELRERIATANSIARLISPRTVAVVGASRRASNIGGLIFRHILGADFTGAVYPVNHQAESVQGVHAYPSPADLPEPVDVVVVAVPAGRVLEVAEQSLLRGAKGLIVVTAGFAESSEEGAALQRRLLDLVRSHGARLVGPNCLGLLNTDPAVRLNASLAPTMPPTGRVGFFSHSAALGIVILQYAVERGLGFSTFVSAGNRADVSGNDLLQYWEEDPSTDLAMLYLETFGNPRRFSRVARRVSARKPVLCVKSARSRAGRSVAQAHIGAAPVAEQEVETLFRQAGVIRVDTLEELFDVATLLAHQPLPAGNRVAIVGNSGGVVTITADACEAYGLSVTHSGRQRLGTLAGPEPFQAAVRADLEDSDVDALIVIYLCIGDCDPEVVSRAIRRGVVTAERHTGVSKPVLLCLMGAAGTVQVPVAGRSRGNRDAVFPSYRFPESAVRALAHVVEYAEYRRQPPGRLLWYEDTDAGAARAQVEEILSPLRGTAPAKVSGDTARALLDAFGISVDEAAKAPRKLSLAVRSDPDFGPLLVLRRGSARLQRLTPLTSRDLRELTAKMDLPPDGSEAELLGRLSQLVEELPWLTELTGTLIPAEHAAGGRAALEPDVRMVFSREP